MEYIKLVKKITDWNSIGIRTRGQPNNRWSDEVIRDLKKVEPRNWIQLVKDRKTWNDLVQKIKTHVGLQCQKKKNNNKNKKKTRRRRKGGRGGEEQEGGGEEEEEDDDDDDDP